MNTLRIIFYSLGIVVMVSLLAFGFVEIFGGAISKIFLSFKGDMIAFYEEYTVSFKIGMIIVCIAVMFACVKGIKAFMN